ncbi:MAG: META domain-containing protein [Gemmatimonadales bacterium]|nr:MAG: META domain-containing protein [Gemmatimonadales bacterium]
MTRLICGIGAIVLLVACGEEASEVPEAPDPLYFQSEGEESPLSQELQADWMESDDSLAIEGVRTGDPVEPIEVDDHELLNREWQFVEVGSLPLDQLPAPPDLYLDGTDGSVAGSTGCNRLVGSFQLDDEGLRFSPAATTRMGCPDPASEVESAILDVLERTRSHRLIEGGLELLDEDDGVIARLASTT